MRLDPVYSVRYQMGPASVASIGDAGEAYVHIGLEGSCDGRVAGSIRATNTPHRRSDGTFEPDVRAVIETADGAVILAHYRGYGFAFPPERWATTGAAWHRTSDERYAWLNSTMCAYAGEVSGDLITLDVAEIVYEPSV